MPSGLRTMDARLVDCPAESIGLLGVLPARPADLEGRELSSHLPCLRDDGDQMFLLDLVAPVDVVHRRPAVVVDDQLGNSVLLGQLHSELDREMLGDDIRGGRNLLGACMPLSLGTLADVEHSRTSTSASIAPPVADGGRLHPFSRVFCSMAFFLAALWTGWIFMRAPAGHAALTSGSVPSAHATPKRGLHELVCRRDPTRVVHGKRFHRRALV